MRKQLIEKLVHVFAHTHVCEHARTKPKKGLQHQAVMFVHHAGLHLFALMLQQLSKV